MTASRFNLLEAGLGVPEGFQWSLGRGGFELHARLTSSDAAWIESVNGPVACIDCELLLFQGLGESVAVGDARRVGNDQRGAGIRFGFVEDFDCEGIFPGGRDLSDIGAAIRYGDEAEVFASFNFAGYGELGGSAGGASIWIADHPCSSKPECQALRCSRRGSSR